MESLSLQNCLCQVRAIQCFSTTDLLVHLSSVLRNLNQRFTITTEEGAAKEPPVFKWTPQWITKAVFRTYVVYLVIENLAWASLYVNGTVGAIKCLLALGTGLAVDKNKKPIEYVSAQGLLEQGVTQIFVAVYDFAVSYLRVVAALACGFGEDYVKRLHGYMYEPWSKPIEHVPNATEEQIQKDRAHFPILQSLGDIVQSACLPDKGETRWHASLVAIHRLFNNPTT